MISIPKILVKYLLVSYFYSANFLIFLIGSGNFEKRCLFWYILNFYCFILSMISTLVPCRLNKKFNMISIFSYIASLSVCNSTRHVLKNSTLSYLNHDFSHNFSCGLIWAFVYLIRIIQLCFYLFNFPKFILLSS